MLALYFGRMRDLSFADGREMVKAFQSLPGLVTQVLDQAAKVEQIAKKYAKHDDFLFLGRLEMFPIALEGALKLKEISYIHAEGYPAAEMKHGPIALICPECPTVAIATDGEMFKKCMSSIQEVRARKGPVIVITDRPEEFQDGQADEVISVPKAHECILPILVTIPLQLLSYYVAVARECDVDKPRNLAKSVTVE
jgi:glucosamine--fructose-6-phosphate aminotransferase (isomerizing)